MMHVVQIVRCMLMDGKYAFHPKWLDATGNNAVDHVAADPVYVEVWDETRPCERCVHPDE